MEQNSFEGVFVLQKRYDELTADIDSRLKPHLSFNRKAIKELALKSFNDTIV